MRVALVVEGEPRDVEVDLAAGTARVGDRSFPIRVVAQTPGRVELEIAGEKVLIDGWLPNTPSPLEPVSLNGERVRVEVRSVGGPRPTAARPATVSAPVTPAAGPPTPGGPGTPVTPPMPGRIVEVRVHDGERVVKGQVLVVLEAMKMRNEILAPVEGRVADLAVAPGSNVRAREPLLRIVGG